ncbi:nardilysin isoform X2 [Octopus vulgaris]|uniref:Nardilysin isoform X2 n=2 Tax=Octopus vulgaris TaxID=6645 RepID=A0AA36BN88_OCTVU|nr:nardilysin isoform X2 [Octopus vulgaris]
MLTRVAQRNFWQAFTKLPIFHLTEGFDIRVGKANYQKSVTQSLHHSCHRCIQDNRKMPANEKYLESSVDVPPCPVIKSLNDLRDYRIITLNNGLRALLISDLRDTDEYSEITFTSDTEESDADSLPDDVQSDTDESESEGNPRNKRCNIGNKKKAAAALCVGVGGMSDPPDIQGLSHFLEHMVFMGSKKYPKENEFDDFLARHGGYSNAWTDYEATVFYFNVQQKFFEKSLDMFAQFFISPLMREDSVNREIKAVDSEFEEGRPDDDNRSARLLANLCRTGHPIGNFIEGNITSLRTDPNKDNIDVYSRLKEYHQKMYSAHFMTLAVQSKETLDVLDEWVREIFSHIPNNNEAKPTFLHEPCPFDTAEFSKFYHVVSVKDTHKVSLNWALTPLLKHYESKPLDYLSTLFLHEGAGSILSYLKKQMWALHIEGGNATSGFEFNSVWSCFYIDIILTDSGVNHVYEVLTVVFQYLEMVKKKGLLKYIYDEEKAIQDMKFRWQEKGSSVDYVERLSENMQVYNKEHFLTGDCLLFQYNEELIKSCLDQLTPAKTNVILLTKKDSGLCTKEEKWYGTKYYDTDFDPEWLAKWQNLQLNPELYLPEPNKYLAKDFSLKDVPPEQKDKSPFLIMENEKCKLWYKKDTKFNIPKVQTFFKLMSPVIGESLESSILFELFIDVLLQKLAEPTYHAIEADLSYSLTDKKTGLVILVKGFNDKIPELFQTIVDELANFEFSDELFEVCKSQLQKDYYNSMIKPYNAACGLMLAVIMDKFYSLPNKYCELPKLQPGMLRNWYQRFRRQIYYEGLVIGNMTTETAKGMMGYLVDKMNANAHKEDCFQNCLLQLPIGQFCCQVQSFNQDSTHSTILMYYQVDPGSIFTSCLNEMLVTRMYEPLFDILRTKHQLGYSVSVSEEVRRGILGFSIVIEFQAHKYSPELVNNKAYAFIKDFVDMMVNLTTEEFQSLKESLITAKKCEDTKLAEEARRHWHEIFYQIYVFNRLEKEVEALHRITYDDFINYVKKCLLNECRVVSLQVIGKKSIKKKKKKNKKNDASSNVETNPEASGDTTLVQGIQSAYTMLACNCAPSPTEAKCIKITNIDEFKETLTKLPNHKIQP